MRSSWDFFSSTPAFFDEGPRSFFEYSYRGIQIILIGEWHSSMSTKYPMPEGLQRQFTDLFSNWIKTHTAAGKKVLLLAEQRENSDSSTHFIDSITKAGIQDGCRIVQADNRVMEDSFKSFGGFLYLIDDLAREIMPSPNLDNIGTLSIYSLWHGKPIIDEIRKYASLIKDKIYLKNMEDHLGKQLGFLESILAQSENKYPRVAPFIAECFSSLYCKFFHKFDEISAWCEEKNISHESLDIICIRLIEESGNLSPIDTLRDLLLADMIPSLDASLAYRLWDEIHAEDPAGCMVLVAGEEHIQNLARFANSLFTSIKSLTIPSDTDSSIHPEQLENLLFGNVQKPDYEVCSMQ